MKKNIKNLRTIFIVILFGIATVIWYAVFYFDSRENLLIHFFDIGQGDAIFIEVPNGNQILIDGGPSARILDKLGEVMPFWDHSIDLLILTHPHADHLDGALEVLKRYDIGMVIESGVNHSIPEYEEWHKFLREKGIKMIIAKTGQRIRLAPFAYFDILMPFKSFVGASPKNVHDAMIVSKLHYGSSTVLLMGDAEKPVEYHLLFEFLNSKFYILNSDILKVGHHGSKTSSTQEFLQAVSPKIAVISVGRQNRYGHPYQEVIDRLKNFGIKIFRTDQDGDIELISDGNIFY